MKNLYNSLKLLFLTYRLNWKTLALSIAIPTVLLTTMFAFFSDDWYSFTIQMKTGIQMMLALVVIGANGFVYRAITQPRITLFTLPISPMSKALAYFLFIISWGGFVFGFFCLLSLMIHQPMFQKIESLAVSEYFSLIYGLVFLQPVFKQSKTTSWILVFFTIQFLFPLVIFVMNIHNSTLLIAVLVSIFTITVTSVLYSIFKNDNLKAE